MTFFVRVAQNNDCERIWNLIIDRANLLSENPEIANTLTVLQRDGFGSQPPYFHCIVAESKSSEDTAKIVGFAMYYHRYSTWESKGLFLRLLLAENGNNEMEIKEKLLRKLCEIGVTGDFCRVSFRILVSDESAWNFYKQLGALNLSKDEGWLLFCFPPTSVKQILEKASTVVDKSPNVIVRGAERRDFNTISKLIKELAEFEKMGDEAKLTGEDLARDCMDDPNKHFRAFVAEDKDNNEVIGFAIFFYTYKEHFGKSIHLEDLYVTPKYRRQGIGEKLFYAVAKVSNDEGYHGFTLECLDWNNPAIQFYEKHFGNNLTQQRGSQCCRFRRDVMEVLAKKC